MFGDDTIKLWELASHLVTVVGLPVAVLALWREARRERDYELKEIEQRDEETYLRLSEQYTEFIESVLRYPDLALHPRLPERAYILLHEDVLDPEGARRWQSWADSMQQWCPRADFRDALPDLLIGEDPAFSRYILGLREVALHDAMRPGHRTLSRTVP